MEARGKCSVRSLEGVARPSRSNRKKEDHNADPECSRGALTGLHWRSLAMLATARMVERDTGIPKSTLACLTEHFTSSPDGYFYCMMTNARAASSTESSLSGAYHTSGRREDKKHAHGGGHDPAVDYNPIRLGSAKRGLLHNPTPPATQQFAPPGRRSP